MRYLYLVLVLVIGTPAYPQEMPVLPEGSKYPARKNSETENRTSFPSFQIFCRRSLTSWGFRFPDLRLQRPESDGALLVVFEDVFERFVSGEVVDFDDAPFAGSIHSMADPHQ